MEFQDYYKTLGVSQSATPDEIKKQYRKLARKYHPDVSEEENAEEQFKTVKEAYEVLKDKEKKAAYDQLRQNKNQGSEFNPPPNWHYENNNRSHSDFRSESDFSDFFSSIFGQQGGFHSSEPQKGQDLTFAINIALEEAYNGSERHINVEIPSQNITTGISEFSKKELKIKIPPGIKHHQHIRLSGQGQTGFNGGERGDIYLKINIDPHKLFKLHNKDIHVTIPITPWEAVLGSKITIPTLSGDIQLKIPANTQSGKQLRLKDRGLPGKSPGHLYVQLKVILPEPENQQQKELYEKMAELMPFNPRHNLSS